MGKDAIDVRRTLENHLNDASTGWSMGTFGALAEFHRDTEEPALRGTSDCLRCATSRGALQLDLPEDVLPVAHETLSANPRRWGHGIALCLPEERAAMAGRRAVTELGPDKTAIREEDREAILFDMGLSALGAACRQVEFCVRTADLKLISVLRAAEGQSIFDQSCTAMMAILEAHPNRVALTRLGRVEVYQPIGGPATGGVSPAGPHTHVLPDLLASGRTHSANVPIPEGLVPCAWAYPANPVSTAMGHDKPFDAAAHQAFEQVLEAWGVSTIFETKKRVREAVAACESPSTFEAPDGRFERTAVRVTLRQLALQTQTAAERSLIEQWRSAYDKGAVSEDPLEAQHSDAT